MAVVDDPLSTEAPRVTHTLGVIASATVAGLLSGLIAGGLGSRLAMRILSLTSPDARGAITEAGEVVGEITLDGTLFLLAAGALLGIGGGWPTWRSGAGYQAGEPASSSDCWRSPCPVACSSVPTTSTSPSWTPPRWASPCSPRCPYSFGLIVVPLQARLEPFFTKPRSRIATTLVMTAGLLPLAIDRRTGRRCPGGPPRGRLPPGSFLDGAGPVGRHHGGHLRSRAARRGGSLLTGTLRMGGARGSRVTHRMLGCSSSSVTSRSRGNEAGRLSYRLGQGGPN